MSMHTNRHEPKTTDRQVAVSAPRIGDRIGFALSSAFEPEPAVPNDLMAMLAMIDANTGSERR